MVETTARACAHCGDSFSPLGRPYSHAATYCQPCGSSYRSHYKAGTLPAWYALRSIECNAPGCLNMLGRDRSRYCSDECRPHYVKQGPRPYRPCDACGVEYRPAITSNGTARFCSEKCRYQLRAPRTAVTYGTCRCGALFCGRHRQKWCKAHRGVMRLPELGPKLSDWPELGPTAVPTLMVRSCESCGLDIAGQADKRFCNDRCGRIHSGHVASEVALLFGHCLRCGELFVAPASRVNSGCCSALCSRRHSRSMRKRAERARKRNQDHESYSLREIAERDGWVCHLCGKKVPDRQYARRDRDPTIDHLIPQSAGGHNTKANVALAHNRCNWERGAGGAAQLRLVG